ncbi:MAG TPA: methionine--tRNA ligase [Bryobacteraceae bacterium]|nr:methionine--tRNA ligase [Bryobacteraceae bacterium]
MKYYLTTPIYYVNAAPHLGTAYSTFVADLIKRFKKMEGFEPVVFTTGSDEHSRNVERAAKAANLDPEEYAGKMAAEFVNQWKTLEIDFDHFIRTSDPKHHETVRELFERCQNNGYIYKGAYTGQYCVNDELYVNEAGPGDPCPECGRPTETVTEENYFFRLSAFQEKLLELYEKNPEFVKPDHRRNEITAFVRQGLNDLSITRTNINWGIPVPVEGRHVFYVWFDALISYMSAVKDDGLWPADLHLIGKDILRFHAVYWPAFLMAADMPLPKKVFAHGWILFEENKMSKSRGNVLRPNPIAQVAGIDGLRYFLLREITFGQDGSFSYDALIQRYNSDLANGLGNLASRTLTMIHQYRGGEIPQSDGVGDIAEAATRATEMTMEAFDEFNFSRGLETIWSLISVIDKFIVERAPWKLAKDEDPLNQKLLDETLYTAAEALRIICAWLYPVMPASSRKIWEQLGMPGPIADVRVADLHWGKLQAGQKVGKVAGVFPRLDAKTAIAQMQELELKERERQAAIFAPPQAVAATPGAQADSGKIAIDDFAKVEMRVGLVLAAERVKGADKLLHLKVEIGEQAPRTIVAGIAEAYPPEQLIGRKVVIVANLQPRKLRGLESNGMIVAASIEGGKPVLAGFLEDVPVGARLK